MCFQLVELLFLKLFLNYLIYCLCLSSDCFQFIFYFKWNSNKFQYIKLKWTLYVFYRWRICEISEAVSPRRIWELSETSRRTLLCWYFPPEAFAGTRSHIWTHGGKRMHTYSRLFSYKNRQLHFGSSDATASSAINKELGINNRV